MILNVDREFIQYGPGRAFWLPIEHPMLKGPLPPEASVRVWIGTREIGRPAQSIVDIEINGDGRCLLTEDKLWLSFPKEIDFRSNPIDIIVDIPIEFIRPKPTITPSQRSPLLIVGPQRCGSTALLWGLDRGTRYGAPKVLFAAPTTLEGYHLRQALSPLLHIPILSPFGQHADNQTTFSTGVFLHSGLSPLWLGELAGSIDRFYSLSSAESGTWIDKCPGWESVIIAPLFQALFPNGRIIYLSREPIACIRSMLRLNSQNDCGMPGPGELGPFIQCCANWIVSHAQWRCFCAPILPPDQYLELSLHELKNKTSHSVQRIGTLLDLSPDEQKGLAEHLESSPVSTYKPQGRKPDPRLVDLIARLTVNEADHWHHPTNPRNKVEIDPDLYDRAHDQLQKQVAVKFSSQGMTVTAADRLSRSLLHQPSQKNGGEPVSTTHDFQPGPMLSLMLADAQNATNGQEPPQSIGIRSTTPHDETQRSWPWVTLQEYVGQIEKQHIEGTFHERADDQQYDWSADYQGRSLGGTIFFRCRFNTSHGLAHVRLKNKHFLGTLRMDGRLDLIEGMLDGHQVRFQRSYRPKWTQCP